MNTNEFLREISRFGEQSGEPWICSGCGYEMGSEQDQYILQYGICCLRCFNSVALGIEEEISLDVGDMETIEGYAQPDSVSKLLCIKRLSNGYRLSIMSHEILAKSKDYCDDKGDVILPDTINGKEVEGLDGEYIIGKELVIDSDGYFVGNKKIITDSKERIFEFKEFNKDSIYNWLDSVWYADEDCNINQIDQILNNSS